MGKIAVLPPAVQGQIAAGEVIERPASVVRELAENALDAGARRIDVELRGGGLTLIAVRDDGEGMAADDACLAFARHATSKLVRSEDLGTVATLGFRGEALPSIAAAARVRLTTRRTADPSAAVVEADADGARAAGHAGAPPGTLVEVQDLFGQTPARRKFLRTAATEVGHVADVLTRLAVASPGAGFRLLHDGREMLALPPVADVGQRLVQVLGRERARGLLPVAAGADGYAVTGLLGRPADTVATARLLWTYVGLGERDGAARRWIRDRLLLRAVLDGYESLMLRGRYPIAILFIAIPPGDVDLNVHPAKLEVRFRRSAAVHQLVVPAVRAALAAGLAGERPAAPVVVRESAPPYAATDALPLPPTAPSDPQTQAGLWAPAPRGFASLRFIGQIFDGYLLCEGDGRIVLIDQHAAHERVVFERLCAERQEGGVARDALLVPETISVGAAEAAVLTERSDTLEAAGLEGEPFGDGTFLLRTVPRLLKGRDPGTLVRAIAAELLDDGAGAAGTRAADAALATVACHSAVRVGQRLDAAEVNALLAAMDSVPIAAHCPHGRPVATELARTQVEGWFRR